jgi:hypothetical protein
MTGKVEIAGSIAALEVITKVAWYYLHERVWAAIAWDGAEHGQSGKWDRRPLQTGGPVSRNEIVVGSAASPTTLRDAITLAIYTLPAMRSRF